MAKGRRTAARPLVLVLLAACATYGTSVRVRRDGFEKSMPAVGLVPGDVVPLGEGDIVPAGCDILEASRLLVDESALTAESSALGQIAALMDTRVQPTPLQHRLAGLGRTLALGDDGWRPARPWYAECLRLRHSAR